MTSLSFSFYFFRNVIISNPNLIREIFSDPNFSHLPHISGFDIYERERLGIGPAEGETWELHRRFLLQKLKEFSSNSDALMMEAVEELLSTLKSSEENGNSIKNVKTLMSLTVASSIWSSLSGQKFKHDDAELHQLAAGCETLLNKLFRPFNYI